MLPLHLAPMLASIAEPFDSPDFTYEIKWDGYRCLAFLNTETRLFSRNQKEITTIFPELTNLHQKIKHHNCILDGEIIALRNGKPSFLELQKRAQLKNKNKIGMVKLKIPVVFIAFDLLYYNDQPILERTIEERRYLLSENTIPADELIVANPIDQKGIAYFKAIKEMGLEGVMAKRKGTRYYPGKRVKIWLKFKKLIRQNFIICGYTLKSSQRGQLSSLILGAYFDQKIQFFGMVGSGFKEKELEQIHRELQIITSDICPFTGTILKQKNTHWVKPITVCEVEYLELTDVNSLRHPVFKRFRPELKPSDCLFED